MKKIELELQEYCRQVIVQDRNLRVSYHMMEKLDGYAVQFKRRLYCGRPQTEKKDVFYPKGWWNAFKAEYPKLCRWFSPVQYNKVTVQWTGKVAFPELDFSSRHATLMIWDEPLVFTENKE